MQNDMNLTSLKLPKKKRMDSEITPAAPDDSPKDLYPYGSTLRFEEDQVKNLPSLHGVESGDELTIYAKCKVTRTEQTDTEAGKRREVSVQITDISFEDHDGDEKAFEDEARRA